MANEVIQCLQDLFRLAAIKDDYTTQNQISSVVNNIEAIFFPSNGVAPHSTHLGCLYERHSVTVRFLTLQEQMLRLSREDNSLPPISSNSSNNIQRRVLH
uniref:Uncharacterized protein n=1 Tax=Cacopsylla melanoneura TaxID=428564 RepID=A0A8D8V912_9HEMI